MLSALPDIVTLAQLAEPLGISAQLITREIKRGKLKCRRIGRRIIIAKVDAQAWLDAAATPGPGDE